ncbi:MAG: ubiquitin-like protein UBact [Nitrospirae bacterium]|nr:ubiquitin-like protein UBact [Nitrospirota bacterium]MDA1303608.1 ubiquitin-like protein UBact [Nitrospirota bacterium]
MKSSTSNYMTETQGTPLPIHCERRERPLDPIPKPPGPKDDEAGPRKPEPGSPSRDNLLKRMRKVDPKQAERYRQRTGE